MALMTAMDEQYLWAPVMFEDELVRGLTRSEACEAWLRAELLAEEASASLEVMAAAAGYLTEVAGYVESLRLECADAQTQVWRLQGDGREEQEAGSFAASDLITTVVAGLAAAAGEMRRWAGRALDLAGWQVFSGLRRVRQAKREERCADRTCELWWARQFLAWLEDETAWWQVLAAAASATAEDGRAQQPLLRMLNLPVLHLLLQGS